MKKLILMLAVAVGMMSCAIEDRPEISIEGDTTFTVSHNGGELIIPVTSTGVDNVNVYYPAGEDWQRDPETGDMIPVEGWVKVVKVIDNYEATRELAVWRSGIQLQIAPNNGDRERTAKVEIRTFTKTATATIKQGF